MAANLDPAVDVGKKELQMFAHAPMRLLQSPRAAKPMTAGEIQLEL